MENPTTLSGTAISKHSFGCNSSFLTENAYMSGISRMSRTARIQAFDHKDYCNQEIIYSSIASFCSTIRAFKVSWMQIHKCNCESGNDPVMSTAVTIMRTQKDEPAYKRIQSEIRQRIDSGELKPGDVVDSERELARIHS